MPSQFRPQHATRSSEKQLPASSYEFPDPEPVPAERVAAYHSSLTETDLAKLGRIVSAELKARGYDIKTDRGSSLVGRIEDDVLNKLLSRGRTLDDVTFDD